MDVMRGHPGAVFHWLFDTDQGTDHRAQVAIFFVGSSKNLEDLSRSCLEKQAIFNDALGIEILFCFFHPETSIRQMAEDGINFRRKENLADGKVRYLFAGHGQAFPISTSILPIGEYHFRSTEPGNRPFREIAAQASEAHVTAVPFFQEAFNLAPNKDYMMLAHRLARSISIYEIETSCLRTEAWLLGAIKLIRPIARHASGGDDLKRIDDIVTDTITKAGISSLVISTWRQVWRPLEAFTNRR